MGQEKKTLPRINTDQSNTNTGRKQRVILKSVRTGQDMCEQPGPVLGP
jgi:hypothetical protein